jgi:two-component system sensor histidine kinase RstB
MRAVVGTIRRDLGTRARILSLEAAQLLGADPVALQAGQIEVVRDEGRRSLVASIGEDRVLVVGPFRDRPGRRLIFVLTWTLVIVLVVGVGLWLTLRPIERRLQSLSELAERFGRGELGVRSGDTTDDGIGRLSTQFDFMADRVEGLLERQRDQLRAVSHELRTPLARLRFGIDALVDEDDRAARERAVAACERDIEELDALIDASLTLARLDMGALRAAPQPGDLAALLAQEAAGFAPLLDRKSLATDLRLPEPLPFDVRNGLRNAARHARARIELRAWTEPASGAAPAQVCIAVDDDGPGVPAAQREAVFAPFRRLDEKAERAGRGYGLGLAIVRRVVESHGGRALMEQSPLGGARLRLSWPAQARPAEVGGD